MTKLFSIGINVFRYEWEFLLPEPAVLAWLGDFN
jgi:hypothetical protein